MTNPTTAASGQQHVVPPMYAYLVTKVSYGPAQSVRRVAGAVPVSGDGTPDGHRSELLLSFPVPVRTWTCVQGVDLAVPASGLAGDAAPDVTVYPSAILRASSGAATLTDDGYDLLDVATAARTTRIGSTLHADLKAQYAYWAAGGAFPGSTVALPGDRMVVVLAPAAGASAFRFTVDPSSVRLTVASTVGCS